MTNAAPAQAGQPATRRIVYEVNHVHTVRQEPQQHAHAAATATTHGHDAHGHGTPAKSGVPGWAYVLGAIAALFLLGMMVQPRYVYTGGSSAPQVTVVRVPYQEPNSSLPIQAEPRGYGGYAAGYGGYYAPPPVYGGFWSTYITTPIYGLGQRWGWRGRTVNNTQINNYQGGHGGWQQHGWNGGHRH